MSKSLIPKLEAIKQRYNEVADLIIQPEIISDQKKYSTLNKEYSDLGKIVAVFDQYMQALNTIEESDEIIADGSDKEFVEMAKVEKYEMLDKIPALEEELKVPIKIADSPLTCVVDGTAVMLDNIKLLEK